MTAVPEYEQMRPPGLLAAARRYAGVIAAAVFAATVAALVVSLVLPPRYEATARLVLKQRPDGEIAERLGLGTGDTPYAQNQAKVATSSPVFARAVDLQGGPQSAARIERLANDVEVQARDGADILMIAVQDQSARRAAERANAVALAYQEVMTERVREDAANAAAEMDASITNAEMQIALIDEQLAALSGLAGDSDVVGRVHALRVNRGELATELSDLQAQQDRLPRAARAFGGGVELLDEAQAPDRPVSPKPLRNAAVSAFVVLAGALGLAWWRSEQVPLVASRRQLQKALSVAVLGEVPRFARKRLPAVLSLGGQNVIDDFRLPAASLLDIAGDEGTVVLIAGPRGGEGTTVVALNLAKAAAQAGGRVVLVDADLRQRGLSRLLGLEGLPGLQEATGSEGETGAVLGLLRPSVDPRVSVMPAGIDGSEPGSVFAGAAFGRVVSALRATGALVVVDGYAILRAPDAALAARDADAVVMVVAAKTTLDDIRRTREHLELVGRTPYGTLLNHGSIPGQRARTAGAASATESHDAMAADGETASSGPTAGGPWGRRP